MHALTTPKGPGPGGEGATLIGVGDDWQAIFGFQGGDASLIRTTADPAGVVQTLCEPITLVNGYRFGQGLADASRAVVTMDPKARDRRIRGLGPEPVSGVPPVSVTGARPTPVLTAELGPTATPTTAAVLAAFTHWIPEHEAETGEEAAEPVTVLVMGRRNIDVSDPAPDARGGAGLDRRRLKAAARQYSLEVEYRTIHAAKGGEADYAVLIDSGVPRSATAPAQLALDRVIAAETGGRRDDEHQLWYVALTRARYAALIVVSDPDGVTSPVTRAIIESADPRLTAAANPLQAWLEPVREAVPCPCCSPGGAGTGHLRGITGRRRHFAGCTNWNGGEGCDYTQPSCSACGTGMLVEAPGGLFECSDPSCHSKQPGCYCRPTRPMAVRRQKRPGPVQGKLDNLDPQLRRASGFAFYNTSRYDFAKLLADAPHIAQNLRNYIAGFSPNMREVLEKFDFDNTISKLDEAGLLFQVVQRFGDPKVDLHPDAVDNAAMGTIFEEPVRKFNEALNENPGEHFTPRDVVHLMVDLLLAGDRRRLRTKGVVLSVYDPCCGSGGMLTIAKEHVAAGETRGGEPCAPAVNPGADIHLFGQEVNPRPSPSAVREMTLIREMVRDCSGLSRMELARTVCELLRWRRPNGGLKARECREFLERLDAEGALVLPDKRRGARRRLGHPRSPDGGRASRGLRSAAACAMSSRFGSSWCASRPSGCYSGSWWAATTTSGTRSRSAPTCAISCMRRGLGGRWSAACSSPVRRGGWRRGTGGSGGTTRLGRGISSAW